MMGGLSPCAPATGILGAMKLSGSSSAAVTPAARPHRLVLGRRPRGASLLLVALGTLAALGAPATDDLARQFASPPDSSRPWVWGHWLHGNVSRESITRELTAIQRAGLGGVTMFDVAQPGIPPGPHRYLEASWQEMFSWEITEARRLGLEVMTQNGPGYSGNGGPWIPAELAARPTATFTATWRCSRCGRPRPRLPIGSRASIPNVWSG
jgi:hypothetical protein